MSHFTESAAAGLIAEVKSYAKRCHFLAGDEPVPCECVEAESLLLIYFPNKHAPKTSVLVVDQLDGCDFYGEQVVFPAGGQYLPLLKRVAKAVVHELFDPQ